MQALRASWEEKQPFDFVPISMGLREEFNEVVSLPMSQPNCLNTDIVAAFSPL